MKNCKNALVRLSSAGKVMASWRLRSGVTFFMFVPPVEAMGEETITEESDVRFEEIVSLDILKKMQLGALSVSNDVDMIRAVLKSDEAIELLSIPDGIRIVVTPQ